MLFLASFDSFDPRGKVFMVSEDLSKLNECPNVYSSALHVRYSKPAKQGHPVLCEHIRQVHAAPTPRFSGRNLRPERNRFFLAKLKHKIFRKSGDVAFDRLVEALCRHSIKPSQIGV